MKHRGKKRSAFNQQLNISLYVCCFFVVIDTYVGGYARLDISGAKTSQCKTHDGHRVAECNNGRPTGYTDFIGRINGSCDHIVLGPVKSADFQPQIICQSFDGNPTVVYQLKGKNVKQCSFESYFVIVSNNTFYLLSSHCCMWCFQCNLLKQKIPTVKKDECIQSTTRIALVPLQPVW